MKRTTTQSAFCPAEARKGLVLLVVLLIMSMSAMVAVSFLFRMAAESSISHAVDDGDQAYAAAMSGINQAVMVLLTDPQNRENWYHNPEAFQNQLVYDDGVAKWYFTVYGEGTPEVDGAILEEQAVRFGLTEEAGKINVNKADTQTLMNMGLTESLAAALQDYVDANDEPRVQGAEQEYYSQLDSPYFCKNQGLGTFEELLMVKGFDSTILFGEDANQNGQLEDNENDDDDSFPYDNGDGQLDTGLRTAATVISYERNVDSQNRPRININGQPQALSQAGLSAVLVSYITICRQDGVTFADPSELLEAQHTLTQDVTVQQPGGGPGGGRGQQGGQSQQVTFPAGATVPSGVDAQQLPNIMDRLTASSSPVMGRVNVNSASLAVLEMLPGMEDGVAQKIVDSRSQVVSLDGNAVARTNIAWLVTESVLTADEFKAAAPYLTGRSLQFRVRCVGFGVPVGRFRIIEAVIDLAAARPRLAYIRDVTRLGVPFSLKVEDILE